MKAFYNENDPYAARWLENLVEAEHIAPGSVVSKSIVDLTSNELDGFGQAHFFAGVGVWSAALRAAGWPDDREVWTGSCPCQPFSETGKGLGFADERHLWPAWFWLVEQRRPSVIFGEQVAATAGRTWLDLVFTDLEAIGYACGSVVFPAAGVGAPHERHRIYWAAALSDADRKSTVRSSIPRQKLFSWAGEPPAHCVANGHPGRMEQVSAYGNALVLPAAQAFVESFLEAERDLG